MADEVSTPDFGSMVAEDNAAADAAAATEDKADAPTPDTVAPPDANDNEQAGLAPPAEDAADAGADDDDFPASEASVRDWAKEVIGESGEGWVGKYKSDEDFIRGAHEAARKIGQRDENSQIVDALQDAGVTNEDIQTLIKGKADGTPTTAPPADNATWDPTWVAGVDASGKPIPSADAPADFEAKVARHNRQVAEFLQRLDPAKLATFMDEHSNGNSQKALEAVTEQVEKRLAQENEGRTKTEWINTRREQLYAGEDMTPLGSRVDELLTSVIDKSLPWTRRADMAIDIASKELGQTPPSHKAPKTGKRQAAPAPSKPKEISDEEHFKEKGDSLMEFMKFAQPDVAK